MIAAHHLIFGRQYSQSFTVDFYSVPPLGGKSSCIGISCYEGDFRATMAFNVINSIKYDYTTGYNTNVSSQFVNGSFSTSFILSRGLKDVYGININTFQDIPNWELFMKQFTKLNNIRVESSDGQPSKITGNIIKVPDSVEKIRIGTTPYNVNGMYIDLDELLPTQQLKYLQLDVYVNTYGNLANLPITMQYLKLHTDNTATFTYTAGKTWSSLFDTLNLGNAKLSLTDTDNLLIDMNNSITTAIGSKVINLANCFASNASNSAVAGLRAKGFTVTYSGGEQQFTFDLGQNVTINGTVTRAEGHDGRLNAIQFGSGNLVSADPLPASSIWSFAFWMKTSQLATAILFESSNLWDSKESFIGLLNYNIANSLGFGINRITNIKINTTTYNDNQWHHIVAILDRNEPAATEIKIYKNKELQSLTIINTGNNTGNFISDKIYIGGRGSTYTYPFVGAMSPIKMFNYALSQTEIDNLYNE